MSTPTILLTQTRIFSTWRQIIDSIFIFDLSRSSYICRFVWMANTWYLTVNSGLPFGFRRLKITLTVNLSIWFQQTNYSEWSYWPSDSYCEMTIRSLSNIPSCNTSSLLRKRISSRIICLNRFKPQSHHEVLKNCSICGVRISGFSKFSALWNNFYGLL